MQLQKLGIEIRKLGNVQNLYADVDRVLQNAQLQHCDVNTNLQVQTVAHALQKMIAHEKYFSICTIDNCMNVSGIIISKERYNIYRAIHCVNWNEMLPEYRQTIVAMILDDFRSILNP